MINVKTELIAPPGIRYISEWGNYTLQNYQFPHILNKTLTGCGFTSDCITNNLNVILCSPRRILLENKEEQNRGRVLYVRNEVENSIDFEKDFSTISQSIKKITDSSDLTSDEIKTRIMQLKSEVKSYWNSCKSINKPCKILVTYDSFRHVKEVLGGDIVEFYVVVDEFQSIFCDAKFKSNTELEFVSYLKDLRRVCFVSATPMLKKYLDMLDDFKDLPYFEMNWEKESPGRVIKPHLEVKYCGKRNTIQSNIKRIIQSYLSGNFESFRFVDEFGNLQEIQSKEAVIYVNSVKDIARVIKSCNLTIDQCNVLVSRTSDNEKLIRQAFGGSSKDGIDYIGRVPQRGEPHKMFTFCTRTVYLGADFYSTCAKSYIFSNANIDCLSVDISMDLPQILGRQRLVENPWKNSAELYVTLRSEGRSKLSFEEYIKNKVEKTNNLLLSYNCTPTADAKNDLADTYSKVAKTYNYRDDYVAVNCHSGSSKQPVFNNLMMVAEIRTFEIQEYDYANRFAVFSNLSDYNLELVDLTIESIISKFNSIGLWSEKMKFLCTQKSILSQEKFKAILELVPIDFKSYLTVFDIGKIGSCKYQRATLELEFSRLKGIQNNTPDVRDIVLKSFKVGERYSKSSIKELLRKIYSDLKYDRTPKAVDLSEWFEIKKVTIIERLFNGERKKIDGFEITSIK